MVNISSIGIINESFMDKIASGNFCQVLCIDMQYNNWIIFNFFISLFIILNTKFNITQRIAAKTENVILIEYFNTKSFNMRFVAYFVAINLFMFALQFAYEPVLRYISCGL